MNFAKRHAEVEEVKGGDELKLRACLLPSETISWQDIQIVSLISGGSFGQVYLARHAGREVCVKRCLLRSDGSMTSETGVSPAGRAFSRWVGHADGSGWCGRK
eukprot:g2470.t1